jgi:mannosyltransferase OCH1-like enzyme
MKYLSESYGELIGRSYGYSWEEQENSPGWAVVRALYEKNYVQSIETAERIPKKIHQIWLGSKLPDKYKRFTETWQQFHPAWEYRLWEDNDADSIKMANKDVFDTCNNNGMKSDILRYEILRQQGGIYVDTDFECLKAFDDLLYLNFFTGISYDAAMVLYIGLIATIPNHPIIVHCCNDMHTNYNGNDAMTIMDLTGPYYFTRCFLKAVNKDTEGVVAFPPDFFYPLPNNIRGVDNPYRFVRPCSYAIHMWNVSWLK